MHRRQASRLTDLPALLGPGALERFERIQERCGSFSSLRDADTDGHGGAGIAHQRPGQHHLASVTVNGDRLELQIDSQAHGHGWHRQQQGPKYETG
jgi:hypothetical protein